MYKYFLSRYDEKDLGSYSKYSSFGALTPLFDLSVIITEASRSGEYVNIDKEINEMKEKHSFISNEYLKYLGK